MKLQDLRQPRTLLPFILPSALLLGRATLQDYSAAAFTGLIALSFTAYAFSPFKPDLPELKEVSASLLLAALPHSIHRFDIFSLFFTLYPSLASLYDRGKEGYLLLKNKKAILDAEVFKGGFTTQQVWEGQKAGFFSRTSLLLFPSICLAIETIAPPSFASLGMGVAVWLAIAANKQDPTEKFPLFPIAHGTALALLAPTFIGVWQTKGCWGSDLLFYGSGAIVQGASFDLMNRKFS